MLASVRASLLIGEKESETLPELHEDLPKKGTCSNDRVRKVINT